MMLSHNMFPVVSGRMCNDPSLCVGNNFIPKNDRHVTWMLGNVKLAKVSEQIKHPPRVIVCLIMYTSVNQNVLARIINYYVTENTSVHLLNIAGTEVSTPSNVNQHLLKEIYRDIWCFD